MRVARNKSKVSCFDLEVMSEEQTIQLITDQDIQYLVVENTVSEREDRVEEYWTEAQMKKY